MYGNTYLDDYYKYYGRGVDDWANLPPAVQGFLVGLIIMLGVVALAMIVLQLIGMWKTFKKAKQKGWAAIVPFYNLFTMVKITGLEVWAFVLLAVLPLMTTVHSTSSISFGANSSQYFVATTSTSWALALACVALVFALNYKIAKSFGKTTGFAVGLTLVPPIFWMILGSSPSIKYLGPDGPYKIKYPTAPTSKK